MKTGSSEKASRTREAIAYITSYWNRRAWWIFGAVVFFVVLMDINVRTDGIVTAFFVGVLKWILDLCVWFHERVMKEWQIVGVSMGFMLSRLLSRGRKWTRHG